MAFPVLIGYFGGAEMLGGLLTGVTSAGVLMVIFQANAGGAWDNAKKMIKEGVELNGKTYHKGSYPHHAAVVGDTVGDPLKDTSGPSLNILLRLMSVVALVIAHPFPLSLLRQMKMSTIITEAKILKCSKSKILAICWNGLKMILNPLG